MQEAGHRNRGAQRHKSPQVHRMRSPQPAQENRVMGMYCKTYETQSGTVLAACDKEIIGKTLIEGEYHVAIGEKFYKGEAVDAERLGGLLSEAGSINPFGKKAVGGPG